ncbi:acyltransferase [Geodermatophilus sp. DF01_2]|uniref:acyltransferase family protein n=1 Tax=Geodermatophilus sp. DF01-2 TaxID=2559610 RepID=UPI0014310C5A|nr:acyltransferase [Geodermatophilus sp. DF01_2]
MRELVAATPEGRERCVDLLRAVAILAVVVGHWLLVVIVSRDGELTGTSVLALWRPAHLINWVFQVMPVFFFVGGYASTASWTSARRAGTDGLAWLGGRVRRLLDPTTAFLVIVVAAAATARLAGVDPELVRLAGWLMGIHLWFLAVYVALVALTPLVVRAHERSGLWLPLGLAVLAALVDLLRLGGELTALGVLNFGLVWLCVFALGVAWRGGSLPGPRWLAPGLATGGIVAVVTLVALGPYPLSMVNVPGAELQNTAPPSLALLALGLAQIGLVLVARRTLNRLAHRSAVWVATVAVNGTIMSIFLWHLVAAVLAGLLLHGTGIYPQPPPVSGAWFALRPVWIAVCTLLLAVLVLLVARFERVSSVAGPGVGDTPVRVSLTVVGLIGCCAGLVVLTRGGLSTDGPAGIPVTGLVPYLAGFAAVTAATRERIVPPLSRRT